MSKSENERFPWPACPMHEIDPENPLSADWGYLSFELATCRPSFDETRPSDDEILSSLVLSSLLDDGDKT